MTATTIDFPAGMLRGFLPKEDETDDIVLRLPDDHRRALLRLLEQMSRNDMTSRGLSHEEAAMVDRIGHSLY